jgi:tripartite-type tricarboxylate transporter receptor subunit TctC
MSGRLHARRMMATREASPLHECVQEKCNMTTITRSAAAAIAGLALAVAGSALAQADFPNRPVRLVNPYAPGGSVDLVSRTVAQGISEIWKHQVIVDNRPGAGTQIGTEIVARAEADGYTMLCNSSAIAIMPAMYPKMRFDTIRDLTPIVQVATSSGMLGIHPGVPAKSVKELIALAKAQPGAITAAVSGLGSNTHLTTELFRMMANIDILVVPYKGGAPAIADLLGGQVKMFFNSAAQFLPLAKSGKVRILAAAGAKRGDYAPDIPTVAESGVPGFESSNWFGIYGPKNLPRALAVKWNDAANQYIRSPQAQETYRRQYQQLIGGTIEEFTAYHKAETTRWSKLVRDLKIPTQ